MDKLNQLKDNTGAYIYDETIAEALPCLEELNIWVQKTSSKKSDGTIGEWISLVSWKRIEELELDN